MYWLTADDAIVGGQWVAHESDDEAILAAASLMNGSPAVEIWAGTRMVAHLTAEELGITQQDAAAESGRGAFGGGGRGSV